MQVAILKVQEVIRLTGLSRSSIDRMEIRGDFPKRRHVGERSMGWVNTDISEWIKNTPKMDLAKDSTSAYALGRSQ